LGEYYLTDIIAWRWPGVEVKPTSRLQREVLGVNSKAQLASRTHPPE
jgi:bifunctional N-acetylglucosamine-1-phosphate-uridyltransferase/glucosamine-1-phosphate-acetyltransferase GlmU-like protein